MDTPVSAVSRVIMNTQVQAETGEMVCTQLSRLRPSETMGTRWPNGCEPMAAYSKPIVKLGKRFGPGTQGEHETTGRQVLDNVLGFEVAGTAVMRMDGMQPLIEIVCVAKTKNRPNCQHEYMCMCTG